MSIEKLKLETKVFGKKLTAEEFNQLPRKINELVEKANNTTYGNVSFSMYSFSVDEGYLVMHVPDNGCEGLGFELNNKGELIVIIQ